MRARIAAVINEAVFPHDRVYWYSWPLWRRLPGFVVRFALDHDKRPIR